MAVSYVLAQPRLGGQACSFSLTDLQCWDGVTQSVNVAVKRFVISHQHCHIARQGFKHCSASESCSFGCPGCLPCIQGAICGGEGSMSVGVLGRRESKVTHMPRVSLSPLERGSATTLPSTHTADIRHHALVVPQLGLCQGGVLAGGAIWWAQFYSFNELLSYAQSVAPCNTQGQLLKH